MWIQSISHWKSIFSLFHLKEALYDFLGHIQTASLLLNFEAIIKQNQGYLSKCSDTMTVNLITQKTTKWLIGG